MNLRTLATVALIVQVATYPMLGAYFFSKGNWRLGVSQLLLTAVQAIIYSGGL